MRLFGTDRLTTAFAVSACVSVAVLSWFGYRAVKESRAKSLLLVEQQATETADLLASALTRRALHGNLSSRRFDTQLAGA